MTINPRTEEAATWLLRNLLDLRNVFMQVHAGDPESVSPRHQHPHGFQLYLPEAPDKYVPRLYVITDADRDQAHGDRTIDDFKESMRRLGADLGNFDVGRTQD